MVVILLRKPHLLRLGCHGALVSASTLVHDTCDMKKKNKQFLGKRRATEGGFLGCDKIQKQLKDKPAVRRMGIKSEGPPARR